MSDRQIKASTTLFPDLPWWLLLIRQKALIGKLPGDHEVCKITKIAVIPLSETEPQDLELEVWLSSVLFYNLASRETLTLNVAEFFSKRKWVKEKQYKWIILIYTVIWMWSWGGSWILMSRQIEADVLTVTAENAFYIKEGKFCYRWKPASSPCIYSRVFSLGLWTFQSCFCRL